jgi:aminoglycoside phosphotransferase
MTQTRATDVFALPTFFFNSPPSTVWTVPKADVADLLRLDVKARLHEVEEKTALFEQRHGQSFEAFKQAVEEGAGDFEAWDDDVEWKAYRALRKDLHDKLDALRDENFEGA